MWLHKLLPMLLFTRTHPPTDKVILEGIIFFQERAFKCIESCADIRVMFI